MPQGFSYTFTIRYPPLWPKTADMVEYSTLGGYAVLVAIGGGLYLRSVWKAGKRSKTPQKALAGKSRGASVSSEKTLEKDTKGSKNTQKAQSKKAKKASTPAPAPVKASEQTWLTNDAEESDKEADEESTKEFARHFNQVKSGTNLQARPSASTARTKSVKQSKAQEKPKPVKFQPSPPTTAPSSAAGGDADDDHSSTFNSPDLSATSNDTPVAGGVSDMLEQPAAGPKVLKVSAPTKPAPQPKKAKAPAEPEETKKQRQNRLKNEQAKAEREQAEKERVKLAEKQRRTAREAEGRAAKDGSTFMASQAPSSSSWSQALPKGNDTKPSATLLDTFDAPSKTGESSSGEAATSSSDWEKVYSQMSEGEQLAKFEEDNWETVTQKKQKNKKAQKETEEVPKKEIVKPIAREASTPKVIEKDPEANDFDPWAVTEDSGSKDDEWDC